MLTTEQKQALAIACAVFGIVCVASVLVVYKSVVLSDQPVQTARSATSAPSSAPPTNEAPQHPPAPSRGPVVFDFKGDRLGMSLDEFKAKYHRRLSKYRRAGGRVVEINPLTAVGGDDGPSVFAPICADSRPIIDRERDPNPLIFEEAWHARAGIVTATLTDLLGEFDDAGMTPTLAGTKTNSHFYAFVDGQLYEIAMTFDEPAFRDVLDAMIATYGRPHVSNLGTVQNVMGASFDNQTCIWNNGNSTITLIQRGVDINTSSLVFEHTSLANLARSRKPKPKL